MHLEGEGDGFSAPFADAFGRGIAAFLSLPLPFDLGSHITGSRLVAEGATRCNALLGALELLPVVAALPRGGTRGCLVPSGVVVF